MEVNDVETLSSELSALESEFVNFEDTFKSYSNTLNELSRLEKSCIKELYHQKYRLGQINEALKKCPKESNEEKNKSVELENKLEAHRERVANIESKLPHNIGFYLKVILGQISVSLPDVEDKHQYKEQYEQFKLIVTCVILVVALLDLMFNYRAIDAALHFLLVWYHCTLTIRESILIENGSRIKGWWRALQFITCIKAGIIIVWPDGEMYNIFREKFLCYIVYTSFLQFLQFYYQHNCLYRLRALGERYDMDITIQGFHSWMWRGLGFLLPFLYLGYLFQLYNAVTLLQLSFNVNCTEWQVLVSSIIFFVLFLGNTITTTLVVLQKIRLKKDDKED